MESPAPGIWQRKHRTQDVSKVAGSSIKVLDKDRLSIRFKDGTELEQAVEHTERRASA